MIRKASGSSEPDKAFMIKYVSLILLALALPASAQAALQGDCAGTPDKAVVTLPAPLSEWGSLVCTPYGHIISNHDGWIWSNPGGYSPVFIPSQMVRDYPEAVGNASYFTEIAFNDVALTDKAAKAALVALQKGFPPERVSKGYRLRATGSLGRSLVLYFFDIGTSKWGIWCDMDGANCNSGTKFMLLDMSKAP